MVAMSGSRANYRERECLKCGHAFRGTNNYCRACRLTDRTCVDCGHGFRGDSLRCRQCSCTDRECTACGRTFRSTMSLCGRCRSKDRTCGQCGRDIRGTNSLCWHCRATERICTECSRLYIGCHLKCPACFMPERACRGCHRTFRGTNNYCTTCAFKRLPPEVRRALRAKYLYTRRARKYAARVAGPVPVSVYLNVLAAGPCVYCGKPAVTVDHITPLSRGGHEAGYNLAPACWACNQSKNDRFLTEWKPERVKYALEHSVTVNAEYRRWRAEMELAL